MRGARFAGPSALPILALVAVTAVWGTTFVVVQRAIAHMAVMDFLAWRFAVATIVMVAVRPRAILRLSRTGLVQGVLVGLTMAVGYVAQTYGLRTTPAAVSGFITGMFVVFTPLIAGLVLRRRIGLPAWLATVLASGGLAVISFTSFGFGGGEALTLVCAFAFALQIVALGEWSAGHDPFALCTVQLATTAVICCAVAAPSTLAPPPTAAVWAAIGVTAVLATAVAFLVQTWAQRLVAPTRVAIVMTMEPVFAGLSAAVAGEHLGWRVIVGGAMVLGAMYLAELAPGRQSARIADD